MVPYDNRLYGVPRHTVKEYEMPEMTQVRPYNRSSFAQCGDNDTNVAVQHNISGSPQVDGSRICFLHHTAEHKNPSKTAVDALDASLQTRTIIRGRKSDTNKVDDVLKGVLDMQLPAIIAPAPLPALTPQTQTTLQLLRERSRSESTRKNDRWKEAFIVRWMERAGAQVPFSPEDAMAFIVYLVEAQYSWAYVAALLTRLRAMHRDAGYGDPTASPHVREVLRGAHRSVRSYAIGKKALLTEDIQKMILEALKNPNRVAAARDAAMLATIFATATRGHDARQMRREQMRWDSQGRFVTFTLYGTKTDRRNCGQDVTLWATGTATCPVALLKAWLAILNRESGPLFPRVWGHGKIAVETITTQNLARKIKKYAQAVGLNPQDYAAHSLRAGCVTSGLLAGVAEVDLMRHTRHKTIENFRRYHRPQEATNLSKVLGL